MPVILKNCAISGTQFEISEADQEYYRSIDVPVPTLCPEERQRRRLSFRNERNLYHRACDFGGTSIISNISPDTPFKVYHKDVWWGDEWDPRSYGRPYDFSRPFFEQFYELKLAVPRISLFSKGSENCEYTNHATYNKNCYMLFNATACEDVYYSTNYVVSATSCIDCYSIDHCELLHNCVLCENCYSSTDLVYCKGVRDSAFLYDCRSCESCFMSWGLRNKKYCIENKQYSKEEYERLMKELDYGSFATYQACQERFKELVSTEAIHRFAVIDQSENCTGDYIFQSKNTLDSFYAISCRDSRFIYDGLGHIDSYDCYECAFETERQYECYGCNYTKFSKFCHITHESHNMTYTDYCFNSHDCFGSISLKRGEYCILNKQYSREEYEELVPRIIKQMKQVGEYGEFTPSLQSPFAYNESVAQDFMPLTKEEALARGFSWREVDENTAATYQGLQYEIPDHIKEVKDDICNAVLMCESSGKHYKIIPQELSLYRKLGVPVPRRCFNERHKARLYWRNPRTLVAGRCASCGVDFQTTYAPGRPEKVYCEACYNKEIY